MRTAAINLARMSNKVHVQFHESVITLLERITPQALSAETIHALYRAAFDIETAALLIITRSEITAQIAAQDRERDNIFRGFWDTVRGMRNHFNIEKRDCANRLWNVFRHYGDISRLTLDAQTAATNDLIRELDRADLKQAMEDLHLVDWRNQLEIENQRFQQQMMERYTDQAGQTTVRMSTARVETDRFYRALTAHADNLLLTGSNTEAATEFVREFNVIIGRFKGILAQRLRRRSSNNEE
jgi:hypothetical protein